MAVLVVCAASIDFCFFAVVDANPLIRLLFQFLQKDHYARKASSKYLSCITLFGNVLILLMFVACFNFLNVSALCGVLSMQR